MARTNLLLIVARIAQIALSLGVFGCSIALTTSYGYYGNNAATVSAIYLSAATAIMGALGLFAINSNPNVTLDPRLYTLVFTLDCIAFASIAAAPTCVLVTVSGYYGNEAIFIIPAVCGYLCLIPITVFIVRFIRLCKFSIRHQGHTQKEQQVDLGYYRGSEDYTPKEHRRPSNLSYAHNAPRQSYTSRAPQTDEDKNVAPPRPLSSETNAPWSDVGSETATLTYQSMMPTRAPSAAAPSYTSIPRRALSATAPSYNSHMKPYPEA